MTTRLKNFVPFPRSIKDDYLKRKMTKNEFDVLIWIWLNANPINGSATISYEGLRQDMRNAISYDNARKIISSLRTSNYIYFANHKGSKGSFLVYPIGFMLSNKKIQTLDYIKNRLSITIQSQHKEILDTKLQNNFDHLNHNFKEQRRDLAKHFSMNNPNQQITTPNNDNETKIYKRSIVNIEKFIPKSFEEQRCWEIAKSLKEEDMAFILSCLKKYGFNATEKTWEVFKKIDKKNIKNPAAYFNTLISKINKNKN